MAPENLDVAEMTFYPEFENEVLENGLIYVDPENLSMDILTSLIAEARKIKEQKLENAG